MNRISHLNVDRLGSSGKLIVIFHAIRVRLPATALLRSGVALPRLPGPQDERPRKGALLSPLLLRLRRGSALVCHVLERVDQHPARLIRIER